MTIFLNEKNNNSLKNVVIKDSSNSDQAQIIISKGGIISDQNNQTILKLNNGIIINYSSKQNLKSFNFQETNFNLKNFKTKTTTAPKIQEINSKSIFMCLINLSLDVDYSRKISDLNCEKSIFKKLHQEVYKRIYLPFYLPLLTIIVSFMILKSTNNSDYKKFKLQIFLLGMFVIIISQISVNFISLNIIRNIFTLILPLTLMLYFYFSFKKKIKISS